MNRKAKLLQEQASLIEERQKLLDLWEAESPRSPTDEEMARADEITARFTGIDRELEVVGEQDARLRQTTDLNHDLDPLEPGEASPLSPAVPSASGEPDGFGSFGELLKATAEASTLAGRDADPRLGEATPDGYSIGPGLYAAATGMGTQVPSDGGLLVDQVRETSIRDKVFSSGEMLRRTENMRIGPGFNGVKIPAVSETSRADGSRWGGIQAFWLDEAGTLTASKPQLRMIDLRLKKLAALLYITSELLEDTVALESFATQKVPLEIQFKAENAIVNGTGAGQPMGLLNANARVTVDAEVGQPGNTIVYENIQNMWARMVASSRSNAVWYINQDIEPQLMRMSLKVGTGGAPVYLPAGGASSAPFATLMGRPIIPVEYCPTVGTEGDIIFADLGQYITIDKGVQSASSMHVRFLNDEMTFRFIFRIDGQPAWESALTPFQGSDTLSPYITLATRP